MRERQYVTCQEMKELERITDERGLSYYQMMENAGTKAAEAIMDKSQVGTALVYCGKGNNGGDGFVVARLLAKAGYAVKVILVEGEPVTTDAITNYKLLKDMGMEIYQNPATDLDCPSLVVDGIYGTGFKGALRESGLKAIEQIEAFAEKGAKVFALDIPSGLGGDMEDESLVDAKALKADCTITFHSMKPVHVQPFSEKYCGEIVVADIGIMED